jgi:hypothetical protein
MLSAQDQDRPSQPSQSQNKPASEQELLLPFSPHLVKPPAKTPRPTLPYEHHGACPFECCVYREWTVERDTEVFGGYRATTAVQFSVKRGEKVVALTGVVVTTKFGMGVASPWVRPGLGLKPGDRLDVIHHLGEGHWTYWFDGYLRQDAIPGRRQCPTCDIHLVQEPETVWWVKIRAPNGREGWTRHPEHFGNNDACA